MSAPLVSVQDSGDVRLVTIEASEMVEHTVRDLRAQLQPLMDGRHKWWVLSLRGVRFLASAGLGLIVQLAHRVAASGGKLALCEVDPQVAELFTGPTNLIQVVPMFATQQEAVNALSPG